MDFIHIMSQNKMAGIVWGLHTQFLWSDTCFIMMNATESRKNTGDIETLKTLSDM